MKKNLFKLITICLLLTSCSELFQQKISIMDDDYTSDLGGFFTYKSSSIELDVPSQIFASQGVYSDKILITWSEVKNAGSYYLERAVISPDSDGVYADVEESDFKELCSYVSDTIYEDVILEDADYKDSAYKNKYYYRVRAENIGEGYTASDFTSFEAKNKTFCGYLFNCPQNLDATKGKSESNVTLTWTKESGAEYYYIYRSEKSDGTGMEQLDKVSGNVTKYVNTILESDQGVEFYYRIKAVNSEKQTSAGSAIVMGYAMKKGAPTCPDNIKVEDGYATSLKQIKITWDEVTTEDSNITITYNLYRNSSEDSEMNEIASNLTATSFINNKKLSANVIYYYFVQTVATNNTTGEVVKSSFSETGSESSNPVCGFILSAPANVKVEDTSNSSKINLRWKPALGTESPYNCVFTYNIYVSSDTSYGTLDKQIASYTVDDEGYINYTIDKHNFYRITTVNKDSLESAYSTAYAPNPAAPRNVTASKNKKLDSDFTANANGVYPVKITWDAPLNESPASYNVYRSTTANGTYKKCGSTTELYYIDANTSAKAGTFFYYKVMSLNINSAGAYTNDPNDDSSFNCRGYGAITRDAWFREYNKTIMHSQTKLYGMHHDSTDSETGIADICGQIKYSGSVTMNPIGAKIVMYYDGYSDFYMGEEGIRYLGAVNRGKWQFNHTYYEDLPASQQAKCVEYFICTGNSDTQAKADRSGTMSGTISCKGMYPGKVDYSNLKVVNSTGGGGYYLVTTYEDNDFTKEILDEGQVSYKVGQEDTGYVYTE